VVNKGRIEQLGESKEIYHAPNHVRSEFIGPPPWANILQGNFVADEGIHPPAAWHSRWKCLVPSDRRLAAYERTFLVSIDREIPLQKTKADCEKRFEEEVDDKNCQKSDRRASLKTRRYGNEPPRSRNEKASRTLSHKRAKKFGEACTQRHRWLCAEELRRGCGGL